MDIKSVFFFIEKRTKSKKYGTLRVEPAPFYAEEGDASM
jgi:hypothetical protein